MKKFAILLFLSVFLSFLYGQDIVFSETCGNMDVSSSKKVDTYTGWDNLAPVAFSRTATLDGFADVRKTAVTTNHVWFPSGKSSDLIISNIQTSNFRNLKLSFEMAAYKLIDANVNKLVLFCNNVLLTLPSATFMNSKFIPVTDIALPNSDVINLRFQFSAENNTNGYRVDNFTITGEKITSVPNYQANNDFNPYVCGNRLVPGNIADKTIVEIYTSLGIIVQSAPIEGGSIEINHNLKKGLYLVRVGKNTRKIIL